MRITLARSAAVAIILASCCPSATSQDITTCTEDYPPNKSLTREWLNQWKNWCTRHGGTVSGEPPRCDPGPNWCKGSNANTASNGVTVIPGNTVGQTVAYTTAYALGQQLGESLRRWLSGSNKEPSSTRSVAENVEDPHLAEIARYQRQQEEARQRLEKQEHWRHEMQQLADEMKGPKPTTTELSFKATNTCFFNTPCQRELEFKPLVRARNTFSDPFEQVRVSACLTSLATQAKTDKEASYLSQQAANAMNGTPVEVDVSSCSNVTTAPSVNRVAVPPLSPQQVTLYKNLLESTNAELSALTRANQRRLELQQQKADQEKEVQHKRVAVDTLKQQLPTADSEETGNRKRALEEALAALDAATEAENGTGKLIQQTDAAIEDSNVKLSKYKSCVDRAQSDPSSTGELLKACMQ